MPTSAVYSSPENRKLDETIRQLEGLLRSDPPVDWEESRGWCGEILRRFTAESQESQRLVEILDGNEYIVGGDEHHVIRLDAEPDRVYKFTHQNNFGCRSRFTPLDPELTGQHFHGETNADPFFYLNRWYILNNLSEYRTRFEGFAPPEQPYWMPRMCVSQPALDGHNPSRKQIQDALREYGFDELCENVFLLEGSNLLLTDAAPRNVRIIDGIPVLFDAIASMASEKVLEWAAHR